MSLGSISFCIFIYVLDGVNREINQCTLKIMYRTKPLFWDIYRKIKFH